MEKKSVEDRRSSEKELTKAELEKMLIENFVNLQKVLTNLSIKFESLSDQISKLLQLFEISAKSFVEKQSPGIVYKDKEGGEKDKEFLDKLDRLLEQNKVIAKGLTLMEEKMRERIYGHPLNIEEKQGYPSL